MNENVLCSCGDIDLSDFKRRANSQKEIRDMHVRLGNGTCHTVSECGWTKDMHNKKEIQS